MSGIFGIFNKRGEPVNPNLLEMIGRLTTHRGPDGTSTLIRGSIGLGCNMFKTTPESLSEKIPNSFQEDHLLITADLRIDNRSELVHALQPYCHISLKDPDSVLLVRIYQKWGVLGFKKLIGDFAFVLWDEMKQTLICVRDYCGVKPLYYFDSKESFTFSSEIKPLFQNKNLAIKPNTEMVAEFLCDEFISQEATLFSGIMRVPPAHYLVISPEKKSLH